MTSFSRKLVQIGVAAFFLGAMSVPAFAQSSKNKYTINFDIVLDGVPNIEYVDYKCTLFKADGGYAHGTRTVKFNPDLTSSNRVFKTIKFEMESTEKRVRYECNIEKLTTKPLKHNGKVQKLTIPGFTSFNNLLEMSKSTLIAKGNF